MYFESHFPWPHPTLKQKQRFEHSANPNASQRFSPQAHSFRDSFSFLGNQIGRAWGKERQKAKLKINELLGGHLCKGQESRMEEIQRMSYPKAWTSFICYLILIWLISLRQLADLWSWPPTLQQSRTIDWEKGPQAGPPFDQGQTELNNGGICL